MNARAQPEHDWDRVAIAARGRIVSVARRVLRSAADAEDAADEAIARLTCAVRIDGHRVVDAEAWLVRTVLRVAIDRARQWVRRTQGLRDVYETRPRGESEDPREVVERLEAREEVWRCILALPERRQQVIVLRDMEGCSFDEVARVLGIGESTARAHAYAGREELRRMLERWKKRQDGR